LGSPPGHRYGQHWSQNIGIEPPSQLTLDRARSFRTMAAARQPPAWPIVDKAARYLAASEYAHQKAFLDDVLTKAGQDVCVCEHTLMPRPDGTYWSWTTWIRHPAATVTSSPESPPCVITILWSSASTYEHQN
jgi:hypothetical protein